MSNSGPTCRGYHWRLSLVAGAPGRRCRRQSAGDNAHLETVATTVERLATDSDRMVGVNTDVPALAESVLVRFVASHTPGCKEEMPRN
jgi:hypothetical protein